MLRKHYINELPLKKKQLVFLFYSFKIINECQGNCPAFEKKKNKFTWLDLHRNDDHVNNHFNHETKLFPDDLCPTISSLGKMS